MKKLSLFIALALMLSASSVEAKPKQKGAAPTTTLELLQQVNDNYQALNAAEVDSKCDNAEYFAANMEVYRLTGKAQYLEYADKWARHNNWRGESPACAEVFRALNAMNPADYKVAHARGFNKQNMQFGRFGKRGNNAIKKGNKMVSENAMKARKLAKSQCDDGNWVDNTAKNLCFLLHGVNSGELDRATYAPVIAKAWQYLTAVALKNTDDKAFTAAFLRVACEMVRYEDASADDKSFTVTVSNKLNTFRQEVVEIDANEVFAKLGISGGRQFQVINACGQEVAYQLTYDGKVLVDVAVRPLGEATLTFKRGCPKTFVNTCYGRMYPERVDDIAWENDRTAYRCYGPALQASGEKAFGNDVWLKNTPDLVVEKRYFVENTNKGRVAKLKEKNPEAADALNKKTSYHYDQGYGLDCYKVGPTLGTGTPALIDGKTIVYPYCYKEYEILDNGPLRFTVKLVYNASSYKNDNNVVEHRILSLDKGSNYCKMTVWYEGLTAPAQVASGFVIHSEDTKSIQMGSNYAIYADPTDNPKNQNFSIFVGALFPNNKVSMKKIMDNPAPGAAGHALGVAKYNNGDKFTYYFGSSWSKNDCRTMQEWKSRTESYLKQLASPLNVTM